MDLKGKVTVVTVDLNRVLDSLSWPFVHFLQCNRFFKKGNTHQGRFSALPGKGNLTIWLRFKVLADKDFKRLIGHPEIAVWV